MRRALVLTNDAARHPFRQHLILSDTIVPMPAKPKRWLADLRFFAVSYVTFFVLIIGLTS